MSHNFRTGLLGLAFMALAAGTAHAEFELNILHINDFHSRFEAINKFDSTCSTEEEAKNECLGGMARVKSAIDAARKAITEANGNVLTLTAGDEFQGSLFYTTYKSEVIAEFINTIGFDGVALGNHEFDDGPDELGKLVAALKVPVLSANTVAGANTPMADKIKPYDIKELGGQKVAIVSVLATDTDETSSPGSSVFFMDEISTLKDTVKDLEGQGVNKIVLLSHVGYVRDQQIAAAVDGIDVIVGGHSHTLLSNTDEKAAGPYPTLVKNPAGVDVPIVQAYAYSKYLGELKVVFDDAGKVISASGAPKLLDASVVPDAAIAARVKELGAPIEELKNKVVAETADTLDGSRETCRAAECSMGNLVSDAMVDRVKAQGITIAIQNGGGLRASIDKGPVTMGEVLTVLPFQNSVATFQLTGADIKAALENGLSQIEEGAGRFPQVAGLRYSFDKTRPSGSRLVAVDAIEDGKPVPLDDAKVYGVVSNNYMRAGGDGYKIFAQKGINAYDFGPSLEDTVAAYLAANSPYRPYLDGRVTEVAAAAPVTAEPAKAPEPAAETRHVIVKGDTFWALAKTAYGDGTLWTRIAEANQNAEPRRLRIGTEIVVPAK